MVVSSKGDSVLVPPLVDWRNTKSTTGLKILENSFFPAIGMLGSLVPRRDRNKMLSVAIEQFG